MSNRGRVTLRVIGSDLDPHAVTRLLGISPTESFRRGDPRGSFVRGEGVPVRQRGGWLLSKDVGELAGIDAALRSMPALIPIGFAQTPEMRDTIIELFVGLFDLRDQDSLSIESVTAQCFAEREVRVVFDFYVAGQDER